MRITFTVYGMPVAKARPRVVRLKNGRSLTFTPDKTAAWEESIRAQALRHRPDKPLEGALRLSLAFSLPRPKSAPRRRLWPDRRPDLDNLIKACTDALSGLLWRDDAQIVQLVALKRYDQTPRVEVAIESMEEETACQASQA